MVVKVKAVAAAVHICLMDLKERKSFVVSYRFEKSAWLLSFKSCGGGLAAEGHNLGSTPNR